jgi:hypothetical protein
MTRNERTACSGGRTHVPIAPQYSPPDFRGTVWTAAPKSGEPYAIRLDHSGLHYCIGSEMFTTLDAALAWVVAR